MTVFQNNMNRKKMKLTDTVEKYVTFIRQDAYIISGVLYKDGMPSRQLW